MTATATKPTKKLTRTCQDTGFTTARVITALEKAWTAIRARHDELPAVVITVASGSMTKHPVWGHFAAMRWQHGTTKLPEILIAGEGLNRPVTDVLATLLHETAHALGDVRGIKNTSRQGRWHNKKFAQLANELGLDAAKDDKIGWSVTTLQPDTETAYKAVLRALETALTAWRHPETSSSTSRSSSNNGATCQCGCPRRIRVSASVLELGPITCGICGDDFTSDDEEAAS